MRRRTKRRVRTAAPARTQPACVLVATYEIDGKLVHRAVSEVPEDDDNLVGISGSFAGGHCFEEFLAMVAAYEAADGQDTPELRAATDTYVLALSRRPCPCGSRRAYGVCCGR